jgi:hypothetical protein
MEATILDGLRPSYIHTIICSTILYALQALIVNTIAYCLLPKMKKEAPNKPPFPYYYERAYFFDALMAACAAASLAMGTLKGEQLT